MMILKSVIQRKVGYEDEFLIARAHNKQPITQTYHKIKHV